jgi:hypothetical protein
MPLCRKQTGGTVQIFLIIFALVLSACQREFSDSHGADSPEGLEARRPVDDVEELPGYLVGPEHVKMVESELRGPPGTIVSPAARAIEIVLWRLDRFERQLVGGVELSGAVLARGQVRSDGSFVIIVPDDVASSDTLICQLAYRGDLDQLFVPSVLPSILPIGGSPAIVRLDYGWRALDYEQAAALER